MPHDLEAACPLLQPGGILALDDAFSYLHAFVPAMFGHEVVAFV